MKAQTQRNMRLRLLFGSVVALAAALLFATTALANGAPKDQPPFRATVAQNKIAPDWFERYAAAHPYGRNLTKAAPELSLIAGNNELPFTRHATRTIPAPDWFERYAAAHPYGTNLEASASPTTISVSGGFHWRDALIGAAATTSLMLLCAAVFAVSRSRRRRQLVHAIGA